MALKIGRFARQQMAKKAKENKVIFGDVQEFTEPEEEKAPKKKKEKASGLNELKPFRFLKDERFIKSLGLLFIFSAIFLLLSGISFLVTWQGDQSLVKEMSWGTLLLSEPGIAENTLGILGAWISYLFIYKGFGLASFAFVVIFLAIGIVLLTSTEPIPIAATLRYSFFIGIWLSLSLGFLFGNQLPVIAGSFGYFGSLYLSSLLGSAGAGLSLVLYGLIFLVAVNNIKFFEPKIKEEKTENPALDNSVSGLNNSSVQEEEETLPVLNADDFILKTEEINPEPEVELIEEELAEEKTALEIIPSVEDEELVTPIELAFNQDEAVINEFTGEEEEMAPITTGSGLIVEVQDIQEEETKEEGTVRKDHYGLDEPYDPTLDFSHYKYPGLELLNDYGDSKVKVETAELSEKTRMIEDTLKNYGIGIKKISATIGPTVTLYEIVPQDGVRIAKIKNLEDDIALSLAALGIRIIAPIPGKGTIGIEVPNLTPAMVSIRSVIASPKFVHAEMDLPIAFGKTISNEVFVTDLAKMPHLLMAGATGQGKSVGLNALLVSLLYKKHPSQIKFVLVDPKKVELNIYKTIERHFLAKIPGDQDAIITDTKLVVHTLNSLCKEMDDRYDLLKDAQVRNLKEYNAKFISRRLPPTDKYKHRFLPYIVVVIDELADLMMTAGKEVELPIARLAQLARAIGIHLILATQRPSVNIITGTIKANFPARVAFRVSQKIDSRTILDANGADQLIGKGDMLFSNGNDLIRLQCAFVDTPEVEKITEFIGSQGGREPYQLPLVQTENEEGSHEGFDSSNRDELFEDAARIIVMHQQGSTSLLQRKLNLGYNRAGRLIDQLEKAGIVGPFKGSKAREVLVHSEVDLEEILRAIR
ncbi:MAG: DNA translocase FtsK 4TM domain-containing protein [Bacteroidia bacterium]